MQNISWKGIRLRTQSYNVMVGGSQLELRRCYRDAGGTPILMVPGFLENTGVFFSEGGIGAEGGLAPFLASQGYDVYLAELRGKGRSWPRVSRSARWGLHKAIVEDIPAHLAMLERLRPGVEQFWLGQGMGGVILAAAYARLESFHAEVLGMVHIGAARRLLLDTSAKRNRYRWWNLSTGAAVALAGFASLPFRKSVQRESAPTCSSWKRWLHSQEWTDPKDEFDYAAALQQRPLPSSLYVANTPQALWGGAQDCRNWINEMGPHDARLLVVGKSGGNDRNYSPRGLLQHPAGCDDHFQQIDSWLRERALRGSTLESQRKA